MKQLLLLSFLFISTVMAYAYQYDVLQYAKNENEQFVICYDKEMPIMYEDIINSKVPHCVIEDYNLGGKWYKSGTGLLFTGAIFAITGGAMYGFGVRDNNASAIKAGAAFLGFGGAMITIGIPLTCFGDNMKRQCNRDFKLYIDLFK